MADEYIRLDTTIIAIDNLINEAATGTMARTLFKAKDTIYNQQRYFTDVQPVDSWIAVKEQLPEIDKYVLIYYPYWTDNEIQVARLCYDKLTFDICGEFNASVNKVTHWRPLPKPPKQ